MEDLQLHIAPMACNGCGKAGKLLWCKTCYAINNQFLSDWTHYCDKECQAKDWDDHKEAHTVPAQTAEERETQWAEVSIGPDSLMRYAGHG